MYDNIEWGDDIGVAGRIRPFKYSFDDFFEAGEARSFEDSWDGRTEAAFDEFARTIARDRRDRIRELAILAPQQNLWVALGAGSFPSP